MTSANFTASDVMEVRAQTGMPVMKCKQALVDALGDKERAFVLLRNSLYPVLRQGISANEGFLGSYLHPGGKIGVLVELGCETDFVARNAEFQTLAREVAMHIASADPKYLSPEEIPTEVVASERDIAAKRARNEGKPEGVLAEIVEGRVRKFKEDNCLLFQPYCRDPKKRVGDLVQELRARMRENITIKRFIRYRVGG